MGEIKGLERFESDVKRFERALRVFSETVFVLGEIEGMKADNMRRPQGYEPIHDSRAFASVTARINCHDVSGFLLTGDCHPLPGMEKGAR